MEAELATVMHGLARCCPLLRRFRCHAVPSGVDEAADAMAASCPLLSIVEIGDFNHVVGVLAKHGNLCTVDASFATSESLVLVAAHCANLIAIKSLHIDDDVLNCLAGLGDDGEPFRPPRPLVRLDLSGCDHVSYSVFGQCIPRFTRLKYVGIGHSTFGDAELSVLLQHCKDLRTINISSGENFTDAALEAVAGYIRVETVRRSALRAADVRCHAARRRDVSADADTDAADGADTDAADGVGALPPTVEPRVPDVAADLKEYGDDDPEEPYRLDFMIFCFSPNSITEAAANSFRAEFCRDADDDDDVPPGTRTVYFDFSHDDDDSTA
jgi:hypothetical protein